MACPPHEMPRPLVQPGLRAITTSVSPGQSQKMPSAEQFASSARTSPAKSSRRSPNRCVSPGPRSLRDRRSWVAAGSYRLSRFAWRRAPVARVPARCFSVLGERRVRAAAASAPAAAPIRLALGAVACPPGPRPCLAARAAASRSARSSAAACRARTATRRLTRDKTSSNASAFMRARVFSWLRLAAPALAGNGGAGASAVLADVFVAGAPDPGLQLDGRVLVKRGELVPLGLGDQ